MSFSSDLAEIRFGCGLSPVVAAPVSPEALLDGLLRPDEMATQFPIEPFDQFLERVADLQRQRQIQRKQRGTAAARQAREQVRALSKAARIAATGWYLQTVLRWTRTSHGFRERLASFWADHFTAMGKMVVIRRATSPYIESAIRPHMTGTFADLLIAATTHPLMLHYLDQDSSIGPTSASASRGKRQRGLNENLAREVLELHTLGVGGPYTQADVRELAELFTGLSFNVRDGFVFRPEFSEPGAETVLGQSYGGARGALEPVREVLRDLAVHPATAAHVARKLAVHFVADDPDPGLVDHVAARFRATGGQLMPVYHALLEHPAAWDPRPRNVKPPADFVASACRALAVSEKRLAAAEERWIRRNFLAPMALMGQAWQRPGGPDGWAEDDTAWITPQGLSARLRWAMAAPRALRPNLPDPRRFVDIALGPFATQPVRFAAAAAETRSEAVGLVLAAPAFQRR